MYRKYFLVDTPRIIAEYLCECSLKTFLYCSPNIRIKRTFYEYSTGLLHKAENQKAENQKAENQKAENQKAENQKAEKSKGRKIKRQKNQKAENQKAENQKAENQKAEKSKGRKIKSQKIKSKLMKMLHNKLNISSVVLEHKKYVCQPFIESTTAQLINNQSFKKNVNLLMPSTGQP